MALPEKPITRKETYLAKIAGQNVDLPPYPITREEAYLDEIAKNGGGGGGYVLPTATASRLGGVKIGSGISVEEDGTISASGGGGTNDYNDLDNQPQINGVTLSGNKTSSELGLQDELTFDDVPTDGSNNPVKSGGVYSADEAIRQWTTAEAKSVSGNPITLTDGSARNAEGLVVTLEPKQSGSGTPSPENVRPITGYTECNVDTLPNADYAPFFAGVKNGTHGFVDLGSLNWTYESNTTRFYSDAISDLNTSDWQHPENAIVCGKLISNNTPITDQSVDKSIAFYTNKRIYVVDSAYTDAVTFTTAMSGVYLIYELATPTTPSYTIQQWIALVNSFNGNDATISFGQTVYGGSVDFKTGKVTVTHAIADMGEFTWSWDGGLGGFVSDSIASAVKKPSTNYQVLDGLCEVYPVVAREGASNNQLFVNTFGRIGVVTNMYEANPTTFKTAMSGLHLCYELATPIELTLTPAELELLKGYNYITTNGTTIALAYLPDSLLAEAENYVDAKIPPAPSSDGTYVLTCTVTSGTPAYSWESAT